MGLCVAVVVAGVGGYYLGRSTRAASAGSSPLSYPITVDWCGITFFSNGTPDGWMDENSRVGCVFGLNLSQSFNLGAGLIDSASESRTVLSITVEGASLLGTTPVLPVTVPPFTESGRPTSITLYLQAPSTSGSEDLVVEANCK